MSTQSLLRQTNIKLRSCSHAPGHFRILFSASVFESYLNVDKLRGSYNTCRPAYTILYTYNPFTPKSDQFQISPAASPVTLWTSMKNLAFHSLLRLDMIILPILTTSLIHFSFKLIQIQSHKWEPSPWARTRNKNRYHVNNPYYSD